MIIITFDEKYISNNKHQIERHIMSRPIIFGSIDGIEEGQWFKDRKEMMPRSFHRNWAAGIDGNGREGAAAIVLSGGYEDDEDSGDEIIYTGAGGNDPNTGKQIENQSWYNRGNAGLLVSSDQGLPVRVIRGHSHKSPYSPQAGYSYAGLYSVVDAWEEVGKSGYKICRFKLVYCGGNVDRRVAEITELNYNGRTPKRRIETVLRTIRDTKMAHQVKTLYQYECQVCGTTLPTLSGRYAEGAHIRPLGRPHNGDDSPDNLLCLCPNHHVLFDKGMFSIEDDLNLVGVVDGKLIIKTEHLLNLSNLSYHRKSHGYH